MTTKVYGEYLGGPQQQTDPAFRPVNHCSFQMYRLFVDQRADARPGPLDIVWVVVPARH